MDPVDPGNNPNNQPPREPLGEIVDPYGQNVDLAQMIQRAINAPSMYQFFHQQQLPFAVPPFAAPNLELSEGQVNELERFFESTSRYPDIHSRETLARATGLSEQQVQSWFLRRRIIRRQTRRSSRADNLADMGQDLPQFPFAPPPVFHHGWPNTSAFFPNFHHFAPPPPVPTPAPAPTQPDRDTEDQISFLVDNLDDQIVQLKQQLKEEQDSRKTVDAELEMARREIEFLKNNSTSEVEELISMTSALELNKTGLAEQNAMLQEQVALLQNRQISLEAELANVKRGGA